MSSRSGEPTGAEFSTQQRRATKGCLIFHAGRPAAIGNHITACEETASDDGKGLLRSQ